MTKLIDYKDFEYTAEIGAVKVNQYCCDNLVTVSNGYQFTLDYRDDIENKSVVYTAYMQSRNKSNLSLFEVAQKVSNGNARLVTTEQKMQERNEMFKDKVIASAEVVGSAYSCGVISSNVSANTLPGWQIDNGM